MDSPTYKWGNQFLFQIIWIYSFSKFTSRMHWKENKIQQFWFCCHMLSGSCQAGSYLYRTLLQIMDPPDNTRQYMTAKQTLSSFIL